MKNMIQSQVMVIHYYIFPPLLQDYVELNDDAYPNAAVSPFSFSGKETTGSIAVADKVTSSTEAIVQEKTPGLSVVMPSKSFTIDGKPNFGTADGEKVDLPTSITSSIPDPTFKPVTVAVSAATQTILGSAASQNGSVANLPLFTFGNKVVPSTELTAADSPSESTKSGPILGLEKVVSSKEPGADDSLGHLGIDKNVNNVPQQVPFTFSSSVDGEFTGLKFGASADPKRRSSIRLVHVLAFKNLTFKIFLCISRLFF